MDMWAYQNSIGRTRPKDLSSTPDKEKAQYLYPIKRGTSHTAMAITHTDMSSHGSVCVSRDQQTENS